MTRSYDVFRINNDPIGIGIDRLRITIHLLYEVEQRVWIQRVTYVSLVGSG